MNIVERGEAFAKRLRELAARSVWDWKQCPHCGSWVTIKYGSYLRHPWGFGGRETVRVQRHLCQACHQTYAETSPWLVRRSWYSRGVRRAAVDHWLAPGHVATAHGGSAPLVDGASGTLAAVAPAGVATW